MTRSIAALLGFLFLVVGVAGFAAPGMMGFHLSPAHNAIHLVSGLLALYYVMQDRLSSLKSFCQGFGAFYLVLGLSGYLFGNPGVPEMAGMPSDSKLLSIIPGILEFGTSDHNFHVLIGALFLYIGYKGRGIAGEYRERHRAKEPAHR